MRSQKYADAICFQLLYFFPHIDSALWIQSGSRFVKEKQLWPMSHTESDIQPALLTSRIRRRQPVCKRVHLKTFYQFFRLLFCSFIIYTVKLCLQNQILVPCCARICATCLTDISNILPYLTLFSLQIKTRNLSFPTSRR